MKVNVSVFVKVQQDDEHEHEHEHEAAVASPAKATEPRFKQMLSEEAGAMGLQEEAKAAAVQPRLALDPNSPGPVDQTDPSKAIANPVNSQDHQQKPLDKTLLRLVKQLNSLNKDILFDPSGIQDERKFSVDLKLNLFDVFGSGLNDKFKYAQQYGTDSTPPCDYKTLWAVSLNTLFTSPNVIQKFSAPLRLVPEPIRPIQSKGERIVNFGQWKNSEVSQVESREINLRT